MLINEREDIKPLFGMDWLREFNWTIRHIEKTTTLSDLSERDQTIIQFEKQFKTNQTVKDTQIEVQIKPGHPPRKQETTPIPYHLQNCVKLC